ncbi:hypothetical protein PRIPAC_93833 [Pristionchus pacificus]|uniref:PDZ domain-containing protein n=1 Tax=Pristionchus pacificus TaxID=54126 RepID=A0A454XW64_PRIPA|nr:hypothetical protein PRIPAC_93833 [Pristionchus pacificus]|eukprot:PDM76185.1 PDZ domain-containing protein [Pristionchus pacificus]
MTTRTGNSNEYASDEDSVVGSFEQIDVDSDNEIVQRGKEVDEDANILEDICSEPESDFVQRIHGEDGQLVHKEDFGVEIATDDDAYEEEVAEKGGYHVDGEDALDSEFVIEKMDDMVVDMDISEEEDELELDVTQETEGEEEEELERTAIVIEEEREKKDNRKKEKKEKKAKSVEIFDIIVFLVLMCGASYMSVLCLGPPTPSSTANAAIEGSTLEMVSLPLEVVRLLKEDSRMNEELKKRLSEAEEELEQMKKELERPSRYPTAEEIATAHVRQSRDAFLSMVRKLNGTLHRKIIDKMNRSPDCLDVVIIVFWAVAVYNIVVNEMDRRRARTIGEIVLSKNKSGFGFALKGRTVYKIVEDGNAKASELRVGDKIIRLNGENVEKMSAKEIGDKIGATDKVTLHVRKNPMIRAN